MNEKVERKCWYRKSRDGKWKGGTLHTWGSDFEELQGGIGQFPVGIVEDDSTGELHSIPVSLVCFKAIPPN